MASANLIAAMVIVSTMIKFNKLTFLSTSLSVVVLSILSTPFAIQSALADSQKGVVKADSSLPFKIGSPVSRNLQKFTGITALSQFVIAQGAQHALHHKLGGHVKVKIRSWSLTDLLSGKVKRFEVRIKDGEYKDVPLGKVEIASQTPIWLRLKKENDERAGLRAPVLLTLKADLSQNDVSKALTVGRVASSLRALKLDLPGLGEQQLEVLEPKVTMADGKIKVNGTLVTVGASPDTGVPITVVGTPKLEGDDRIVLKEMAVESTEIVEPEKFADFIEELLNPLVTLHRFDRATMALRLNSISVAGNAVHGEGRLLLAPRPSKSPANPQTPPAK